MTNDVDGFNEAIKLLRAMSFEASIGLFAIVGAMAMFHFVMPTLLVLVAACVYGALRVGIAKVAQVAR